MSRWGYVLILTCDDGTIKTRGGRVFRLSHGVYAYIGSCGNHCHARIMRHLLRLGKPFWHVDYLRNLCRPLAVVVTSITEDELAIRLVYGGYPVVAGFGNSDKPSHASHLIKLSDDYPVGNHELLSLLHSLIRAIHRAY